MAQPYLDNLNKLIAEVGLEEKNIECKHFFSGAACYVNGKIFASLTPVGFALKLPEKEIGKLMKEGGKPLQYFPKAPIKKGYVVLAKEMLEDRKRLKNLIELSMKHATVITKATLTCPKCNAEQEVEMPTNACQHFYKCTSCGEMLTPKEGDCCVFCSYADSKCPPTQEEENAKK